MMHNRRRILPRQIRLFPSLLLAAAAFLPVSAFAQSGDEFLGNYEQAPAENDWHKVAIERGKDGQLRWTNAANRDWSLELRGGKELWAGADCPYGESKLGIRRDDGGKLAGLEFNGGFYRLLSPPKKAPIELKFGERATLSGRIEQIKTNDGEGNAVFPFYLFTDGNIIVRPPVDFDPGDCDTELDGMEVKLIGIDESKLERYNGKEVTIAGSVSAGTDLHCFAFGLYVNALDDIKVKTPGKVDPGQSEVTTPERGSKLRKEICDAFRVPMGKEVNGQDIVFVIHQLNVMGDWAFIHCSLQLANGKEVDWSKTRHKVDAANGELENNAAGLFKKDSHGKWSVVEHSFNHTDVVWDGWDEKHGVSKKLFE